MGKKKRRTAGKPPASRRREPLLRVSLPALHPVHLRRDVRGLAALFLGALVLYAASTPRTVMLEDDGLFVTTASFAGVAHPPGYPLYVVLGWLASLVPFGSVAWRVHTLSGLMGACTCACIAWLVLRRTGNRPAAYLAGAALAVSEHFWSQAIIADVYTTNTAAVFLTLALVQEAAARRSTRLWVGAAAVYGCGLANHYPLLMLASPVFLAYGIGARNECWRRLPALLPVAAFPAAVLYGWMVWRSHQPVPVNFLGPISSWSEFLIFLDRSIYGHIDTNVNAGLTDKLQYAGHFVTQALWQFGSVGSLVALWGAWASYRNGWRLGLVCEALAFTAGSFLLIAMLGFNYEPHRISTFRPYPLVAYGILALWLGYGLHALAHGVRERSFPPDKGGQGGSAPHGLAYRVRERARPAARAACALAVAALGVWNSRVNYRPHNRFAEEQAQAMLDIAAEDTAFVLYADPYVGPIAYLHYVEGRRPHLRLLEYHGLFFADRIADPLSTMQRKTAAWAEFLRKTDEPVYSLWFGPAFSGAGLAHLGFFVEVYKEVGPGRIQIRANDAAKAYFRKLIAMPEPKDLPSAVHRNEMLRGYGEYLGLAQVDGRSALNAYVADVLPAAEDNYWSLMGMAKAIVEQPGDRTLRLAETYLRKALAIAGDDRAKEHRAMERFVEEVIERRNGRTDRARALFRESVRIDRASSNPAHQALGGSAAPR